MYYKLLISGEMENVAGLEPTGGLDDPSFAFHFKLKYENCGESSAKETCVSLDIKLPLPSNNNFYVNLVQKRSGMVFENIDLVSGEWAEYDELLKMPVTISHLKSKFVPLDRKTLDRIYSGFRVRPEAIHGA